MSSSLDMLVVSIPRNSKYFTRLLVESRGTTCLLSSQSFLKNCTASMGLVSARSRSAQGLPERDLEVLRAAATGLFDSTCRALCWTCLRAYSPLRSGLDLRAYSAERSLPLALLPYFVMTGRRAPNNKRT